MIDTHCHLDACLFDDDRESVLARALAAGVRAIVVPSTGPMEWDAALALGEEKRQIAIGIALGIHPHILPELDPRCDAINLQRLESLLEMKRVVAVGECGLDKGSSQGTLERQLEVLAKHVALSRRFNLPIIVHCLKAHDELLQFMEHQAPPTAGAVLHSFSGSAEQVREYTQSNWGSHIYFSFAGPVTYKKARKPLAAARAVPRGRLLIETDAPDQIPQPFFGRCEPAHLTAVANSLASALDIESSELIAITEQNARAVFRLLG